ncbi:MAG: ATP-binding response regulator [Elusimicrobiales bacterium]
MPDRPDQTRVLIIEDNPADAETVQKLFASIKSGNFSLLFAETLAKGQEVCAGRPPDVVLLDLNLPDSYGSKTLTRAEELFPDRPIIVMTGFYEEHLGRHLIKKGAQDYLVKGKINPDWLFYSIEYAMERAKIETRMKLREAHLREILEKSPDAVMVARRDGRVLFANHGAEVIFGHRREDLLKHPLTLEADPERTVETELRRLDGKRIPLEIRAVEIHWDSEPCRLILLRDLTPVRSLERHRDEFISRVSHELRAPLTVVKESMELVSDGTGGEVTPRQKEILKIGLDNAARLNRLIDAMLDMTKIEAGVMALDLSRADIRAMLGGIAADYLLVAGEKRLALKKDLPEAPMATYCDADKVNQVLVNLVSNAIKFTPEGGEIKLTLRPWEGEALICVENSGAGIEQEDIPRLFGKFTRLGGKAASGQRGTGLGLAISKGIIEMHRGRIWVESQPGQGCKFYILLPLLPFEGAIRGMVRREIEFSGPGKREFCVVTLKISSLLRAAGERAGELALKTESFLKAGMRNAHAVVKKDEGEFTLILSGAAQKDGKRACNFLENGVRDIFGGAGGTVSLLAYPADFGDEDSFMSKQAERMAALHG